MKVLELQDLSGIGQNKTKVGLKDRNVCIFWRNKISQNKTKVGLKVALHSSMAELSYCQNKTKVGLKVKRYGVRSYGFGAVRIRLR